MGNEFSVFFDLAWKLLLVLGLAVLAMRALKWLSSPSMAPESLLKILARLPIGPQQTLVLVAVGKKRILVGQTSQQLTLLAELAAEDLPSEDDGLPAPTPGSPRPKILQNLFSFTRRPDVLGRVDRPSEDRFHIRLQQALATAARSQVRGAMPPARQEDSD